MMTLLSIQQSKVDLVIDGGYGDNRPSSIIDLTKEEIEIIREGKGDIQII